MQGGMKAGMEESSITFSVANAITSTIGSSNFFIRGVSPFLMIPNRFFRLGLSETSFDELDYEIAATASPYFIIAMTRSLRSVPSLPFA